jgi:DNA-binding CsgD family transcriptional regulator
VTGPAGAGKTRLVEEALQGIEFRLFTASSHVSAARKVVVADDAHLLDADALRLLSSQRDALVIVVAEKEPAELSSDDSVERIELARLTLDEVRHLLIISYDYSLGPATTKQLYDLTEGNLKLISERVDTARVAGLSVSECEIAEHAADGLAFDEIGARLGLSADEVDDRMRSIYRKLGVDWAKQV